MAGTCPKCGNAALEDGSMFCNKCGYRLPDPAAAMAEAPAKRPEEPPQRTVIVSQNPRRASVTVPVSPPVQRPVRTRVREPEEEGSALKRFLFLDLYLAKKLLPVIYLIGALAITLISLFWIMGTDVLSQANLTASAAKANTPTSPLYWLLVLIFGNILWRIACEGLAVLFKIHDSLSDSADGGNEEAEPEFGDDDAFGPAGEPADYVKCPHCGKTVTRDQLRECEVCGIQGCDTCVRMTGLMKKTPMCRECFENR